MEYGIKDEQIELINRRSASTLHYFSIIFADVLPFDITSYHYSPFQNWLNNPWHMHSHIEMQYVFQGKAKWATKDTEIEITPGTLMIIPQEILHHRVGVLDRAQMMGIHFHIKQMGGAEENIIKFKQLVAEKGCIFELPEKLQQKMTSIPSVLLSEKNFREKQAAIILGDALMEIFQQYFASILVEEGKSKKFKKGTQDFRDQVYHGALKYVNDNLNKSISLDDIAKTCGVSSRHLNRIFSQYEGMTLGKYFIKRRIDKSFNLLGNTVLPLNEIAQKLGFSDSAHFIRTFQKFTGITPGEYRRQVPLEE